MWFQKHPKPWKSIIFPNMHFCMFPLCIPKLLNARTRSPLAYNYPFPLPQNEKKSRSNTICWLRKTSKSDSYHQMHKWWHVDPKRKGKRAGCFSSRYPTWCHCSCRGIPRITFTARLLEWCQRGKNCKFLTIHPHFASRTKAPLVRLGLIFTAPALHKSCYMWNFGTGGPFWFCAFSVAFWSGMFEGFCERARSWGCWCILSCDVCSLNWYSRKNEVIGDITLGLL